MKLAPHFHKGYLKNFVVSDANVRIFSWLEAGEDR